MTTTALEELEATPDYLYLNSLITGFMLLTCMDKLKETPYYKQAVKKAAKELVAALEQKLIPDMELVCGINDSSLYSQMDLVKMLIAKAATIKTKYIGVVLEIIKKLEEQPEETLAFFEITLVPDEDCLPEGADVIA